MILPVSGHVLTHAEAFDKVKDTVVEGGFSYRVERGNQRASANRYVEDTDKNICILAAEGVAGKPAKFGHGPPPLIQTTVAISPGSRG